MPTHLKTPTRIAPDGNKPKIIDEFVGLVNSKTANVSVARMKSPPGWEEPGQCPEFDEVTYVLTGALHVKTRDDSIIVKAGEAVISHGGEWIQYSTPGGAEYIAVCVPAFSPETVNRDDG